MFFNDAAPTQRTCAAPSKNSYLHDLQAQDRRKMNIACAGGFMKTDNDIDNDTLMEVRPTTARGLALEA